MHCLHGTQIRYIIIIHINHLRREGHHYLGSVTHEPVPEWLKEVSAMIQSY